MQGTLLNRSEPPVQNRCEETISKQGNLLFHRVRLFRSRLRKHFPKVRHFYNKGTVTWCCHCKRDYILVQPKKITGIKCIQN